MYYQNINYEFNEIQYYTGKIDCKKQLLVIFKYYKNVLKCVH